MKKNLILTTVLAFLVSLSAKAEPITFLINDELGRDNVSFTSDAPVEVINGRTTNIDGKIIIDKSLDISKSNTLVSFEVDLASIDTGIPLRNEHMRDNFLETKKHPKATFTVKSIKPKNGSVLENGKKKELIAKGDFTVHGVTVAKEIPVFVTYIRESEATHARFPKGSVIRIQSTFPVALDEHNIEKPKAVFYKLADTIFVTIDAFANEKKGD